jgi:ATP-dependent RNA circularization protein (DNA/RNA ligase family)
MKEYHKINSIFERDMNAPKKPFIIGKYSEPEIEYLKDCQWEFNEKIDGTNIRIIVDKGFITFSGKDDNSQIPPHLYTRLQELFWNETMMEKLKKVFTGGLNNICLYGEGFGYKIQGEVGTSYLGENVNFCLFDVKIGNWWLERKNVYDIADKLNLLKPQVVGYGTINDAIKLVKTGFKSSFGDADAEGLVLRPVCELCKRNGERIITKVKTRDFR